MSPSPSRRRSTKNEPAGVAGSRNRSGLGPVPDLAAELRRLLDQIPLGRVATCGALAEALGDRAAACWIGHYLLHHEHGAACPCHRVVRAGGALGPWIEATLDAKARRLVSEGVEVERESVDLARFGFNAFVSDRPLAALRRIQQSLTAKVRVCRCRLPRLVGGVDVSYVNPEEGVAAYALVDLETRQLAWSTTLRRRIVFPYVTSYLAFRELPILLELLDEVRQADRLGQVVLVDGSGILHQRQAGIASHLGVAAALRTIGVTKKLLCGQVDVGGMAPEEARPVVYEGRTIGMVLRPTAASRRPIFVSPGHGVDVGTAEVVVRRLLAGRRLPEPLYWADRLSRAAAHGSGA